MSRHARHRAESLGLPATLRVLLGSAMAASRTSPGPRTTTSARSTR